MLGLAGLLLALATLTRPEGALVFGVTMLHGLAAVRREGAQPAVGARRSAVDRYSSFIISLLLAYAAIVAPFFLWRYTYYGDLLPNTFYAKTGGGLLAALRGLEYAYGFALAMGGPFLLLAFGSFLMPPGQSASEAPSEAEGPRWPLRLRSLVVGSSGSWPGYLTALCGVYTVYIIAVGGDHFPGERFFAPLVPWMALLIAGGLSAADGWLRATRLRPLAPALLAALLAGYGGYAYTRGQEQDVVMAGSDESLGIWRELGWWLAERTPPDASVAALSAGAVAFYSDRTTIDMLGLADRHIARIDAPEMGAGPAGHEKRDPAYVLSRRPTYIPQMWEEYFGGADALRGQYELIAITTRYGRTLGMWRIRE